MRRNKIWVTLLLALICGECTARAMHDPFDIDFFFDWSFWDKRIEMNLLIWRLPENTKIPLTMGGFRGTWQPTPKKEGTTRIIATGAGHLFADNLSYGFAWTERLAQNMQDKGINTEVWNMGVNGSTVLFLERCLLESIIEAKPNMVILSHSGYNESLHSYVPERNLVFPTSDVRNAFLSSALFRQSLKLGAQLWNTSTGEGRKPKVSIDEFLSSYDRIITSLQQEGVSVILLQQEVITPDIPPIWHQKELEAYRAAFASLAQKHMLLYVDPRQLIQGTPTVYFDEQEYYSEHMHLRIAKIISSLAL